MFKLTKYELYGRYKFNIGIILATIVLNCLILYKMINPQKACN